MKILYITPRVNNDGGVARILSIKTNFLIQKYNYQIGIVTQNKGNFPLFFDFNKNINFFDVVLKGNVLKFISLYKKGINDAIKNFNPDVVVVTDNGLKGFLFKYLIKTKIPIILEVHASKYNSLVNYEYNLLKKISFKLQIIAKQKGLAKFSKVVFLSNQSKDEWQVNNYYIIPNINWIKTNDFSTCKNKIAICVARNSYEKGIDRLLLIWKKIIIQKPEWKLQLYTQTEGYFNIKKFILDNNLENNVEIYSFNKDMINSYKNSSIYLMTSRDEGMPMVLIEAMSIGLPIIAFDCPIGPKSLIKNNYNGFLINNNDNEQYISKTIQLMNDNDKRLEFGKNGVLISKKYVSEIIMNQWKDLFDSI